MLYEDAVEHKLALRIATEIVEVCAKVPPLVAKCKRDGTAITLFWPLTDMAFTAGDDTSAGGEPIDGWPILRVRVVHPQTWQYVNVFIAECGWLYAIDANNVVVSALASPLREVSPDAVEAMPLIQLGFPLGVLLAMAASAHRCYSNLLRRELAPVV